MITLFKYVLGDWQRNRGYLYEDLETIEKALNKLTETTLTVIDESTLTVNVSAGALPASGVTAGSYGAADQTITITVDASGLVTAINDTPIDGLLFAALQDIATQRLLGRYNAGSGSIEEITLDSSLTLSAGGELSVTATVDNDHVLMSDGSNPPNPMDDGAGNFLYVPYSP